ncbi:hypothetical protein TNCV_768551 [Trichonephila clavipes]|nr:hypothetical protein TNCV_768551 [Trichonephila clavipes]
MKLYDQKAYKLPPSTPAHVPAETNKRPLEEQPGISSKRNRVFITPIIRPYVAPVLIARPSQLRWPPLNPSQIHLRRAVFEPPVQIQMTPEPTMSQPPVQLILPDSPPVQILLSDPPVIQTLEPTLTDDSSIDQMMSSVFGDCSQQ